MRLILFRRGVLVHRASGLLLAAALVASSCARDGDVADTVDIDFSQRVHRDVLAEPGSATSNSVDVPSGHLVVRLARETVTLYGSHNTVRFQQAESESESDGKNQIVWVDASQPDLSADEAREAIRNLVELTEATADWDQVDAFLDGRLADYFVNRPSSSFMVAFWHNVGEATVPAPVDSGFLTAENFTDESKRSQAPHSWTMEIAAVRTPDSDQFTVFQRLRALWLTATRDL